jgi:diadenosine tetraphosphate (Ap4A) HIT family hydrolase
MNATIERFGFPATLIREYEHWLVLLRPQQPTLGSLVLAAKSDATAFSDLDPAAFTELGGVTADTEHALQAAVGYQRINYLMLMMVDPHVHFHVIPRYEGERSAAGFTMEDKGWPKMPDLGTATSPDPAGISALAAWLKPYWAGA